MRNIQKKSSHTLTTQTMMLDASYSSQAATLTAEQYAERMLARRTKAEAYFKLLPSELSGLADSQMEKLEPKICRALHDIEMINTNWEHVLKPDELLGQEFNETSASLWPCSRSTGSLLHALVLCLRPKLILELGTSAGYSTLWMANACRKTGSRIKTVEYLEAKVALAAKYFEQCSVRDIVTQLHDDIRHTLSTWKSESPDFVFMDANKEWQKHYLQLLSAIIRPGSIIITDNAFDNHDITLEFLRDIQLEYWTVFAAVDGAGTLISIKR